MRTIESVKTGRSFLLAASLLAWPGVSRGQVTEYVHEDALGSVRALTNDHGEVVRYDYLPFGEEERLESFANDFKFAGKERDRETGLDYSVTTYYASRLGRFTSPTSRCRRQPLTDPQQWNAYAYARGNPLRYTQPDGRQFVDVLAPVPKAPLRATPMCLPPGRGEGAFSVTREGTIQVSRPSRE